MRVCQKTGMLTSYGTWSTSPCVSKLPSKVPHAESIHVDARDLLQLTSNTQAGYVDAGGKLTDLSKVQTMTCSLGLDLPSPRRILQTL